MVLLGLARPAPGSYDVDRCGVVGFCCSDFIVLDLLGICVGDDVVGSSSSSSWISV